MENRENIERIRVYRGSQRWIAFATGIAILLLLGLMMRSAAVRNRALRPLPGTITQQLLSSEAQDALEFAGMGGRLNVFKFNLDDASRSLHGTLFVEEYNAGKLTQTTELILLAAPADYGSRARNEVCTLAIAHEPDFSGEPRLNLLITSAFTHDELFLSGQAIPEPLRLPRGSSPDDYDLTVLDMDVAPGDVFRFVPAQELALLCLSFNDDELVYVLKLRFA